MKLASSLRYRIALTIFILEIFMVSITLWQTLEYTEKSLRQEAKLSEQSLVNLLANLSRSALFSVEYDEMQEHIDTIIADARVIKIDILDDEDKIVMSDDYTKVGKPLSSITKDNLNWTIQELDGMGKLYILFSADAIEEAISEGRRIGVGIALFGMGFIAIVSLLLGNFLTYRLDKLIKAVSAFSQGDLSISTRIEGKDEIALLGNSFEQMRLMLHEKIDSLNEINDTLEKKVNERTRELEVSKDELIALNENLEDEVQKELALRSEQEQYLIDEEQMASLGRMVSGIAHEINTPIGNALLGISQISSEANSLSKKMEEGNMTKNDLEEALSTFSELSRVLEHSLQNVAKLVKSFKSIAVGQSHDILQEFELKPYLDDIVRSMHNQLKQKKIILNIDCDEHLRIQSYQGLYSQIFTNLINNSLLHGFDERDSGEIAIIVYKIANRIHITYKDNGKGIKKEDLPHVFEAFYTTKKDDGGTGQGMYIVLKIIHEQLHGSIELVSDENKGVEFRINIQANVDKKEAQID